MRLAGRELLARPGQCRDDTGPLVLAGRADRQVEPTVTVVIEQGQAGAEQVTLLCLAGNAFGVLAVRVVTCRPPAAHSPMDHRHLPAVLVLTGYAHDQVRVPIAVDVAERWLRPNLD